MNVLFRAKITDGRTEWGVNREIPSVEELIAPSHVLAHELEETLQELLTQFFKAQDLLVPKVTVRIPS